jgi:deoxyribonuclease IV
VKGKVPPLGAHVSVAGGVHTAPDRGKRIGADVIQIFSKHNTRWMGKALEEEDIRAFREETGRTGVRTVSIHSAYLINLGSSKETVRTRSLYALEDEASRAAMLGVPYLVMHPGSCGDDPAPEGVSRIASALRSFGRFPKGVTLLLENTAGQGNSIGRSMQQLRDLLDAAGSPPDVAVCLDSAHLFASGYDIGTEGGWKSLLAEMASFGILPLVRMWHMNDSKTPLGSCVDRHEHLGQGKIPLSAFHRILTHEAFSALPMVVETPKDGEDEFEMDLRNLGMLRKLAVKHPKES